MLFPVAFIDRLKLLSPRTWWGIINLESKKGVLSPFFDTSKTVRSAIGLLLPLLVLFLWRLAMVRRNQSAATIPSTGLLIAALISPWSLQCFHQLCYQLSIPFESIRTAMNTRSSTLPRAIDALKLRIRHRRAYRTRRYDVYLPPMLAGLSENVTKSDVDTKITLRALLFIPGAAVAHEAYSEVAARLSDKGFVVAVMSLEPLRLADRHFGANLGSVKRIIEQITLDIHGSTMAQRIQTYQKSGDNISRVLLPAKTVEWTFIGHSMGSFAAMQLFRAFCDHSYKNTHTMGSNTPEQLEPITSTMDIVLGNKLVLWGTAAVVEFATDLSDQRDAQILIVQGTNDEFVELMRSRQDELDALFPPATRTEHIVGGTHDGFGSYQSSYRWEDDGTKKFRRSASLNKQQKRACDATVRFLRS
jgi:pimeloyl-ACP methyl ester carboxylesterase